MSIAVEFDRVSIVFGDQPDRALPLMDDGQTRSDIQAQTGQILGVHDCSLSVATGFWRDLFGAGLLPLA